MLVTLSRKRYSVDLVLIDTYSTLNYWYAVSVAKLCQQYDIPYIPILHGGNLPHRAKSSRSSFKKLIESAFVAVCPSKYLQESLSQLGFSNFEIIKNTVAISDYDFKARKSAQPNLLWVRSFSQIYNPEMAVKVLKFVKAKYSNATLCMIGPDKDGSLERTKKLAQGLDLNVEFTGKMTKEAWRAKSLDFDIFINTTHFDNLPISLIESMALGLPIVSTNVGGITYLINDGSTGLLVGDKDVDHMCESIEMLIQSPELTASISENARLEAEKYGWNIVKEEWKRLLSKVPKR